MALVMLGIEERTCSPPQAARSFFGWSKLVFLAGGKSLAEAAPDRAVQNAQG